MSFPTTAAPCNRIKKCNVKTQQVNFSVNIAEIQYRQIDVCRNNHSFRSSRTAHVIVECERLMAQCPLHSCAKHLEFTKSHISMPCQIVSQIPECSPQISIDKVIPRLFYNNNKLHILSDIQNNEFRTTHVLANEDRDSKNQ